MPNWCMNTAAFRHTNADMLSRLASCDHDARGLFAEFVPIPEDQKNNWYDWCCTNWGTKWDASEVRLVRHGDSIEARFDTAWGPPIEWYQKMLALGFRIEATYLEPGLGFCGEYSNGHATEYDFDNATENIKKEYFDYFEDLGADVDK